MRFLENFVSTPIAGAIGWTLLHSLWEGAIVSAALAAVLLAVRSPRVRYAAACAAMLVMLAGFGLTLLWLLPERASGRRNVEAPVLYLASLSSGSGAPDRWAPSLAASRLGSGPSGSREFAFSAYGIWLTGHPCKECAGGACVAPQTLGKERLLVSAPNCEFDGRCFSWNPASPRCPWFSATSGL